MGRYYERYCAGEFDVWRELIALGGTIRRTDIYADARAVAAEIVSRAYANLKYLHGTLSDLGYEFARPEHSLREADSHDVKMLDDLERRHGRYQRSCAPGMNESPLSTFPKLNGSSRGATTFPAKQVMFLGSAATRYSCF